MNMMTSRLLMLAVVMMFMQSSEAIKCYECGPQPECHELTSSTCDTGDVCITVSNSAGVLAT